MALSSTPFALQAVPVNADVVRQAVSGMIPAGGGVINSGDFAVSQTTTPSMGVRVAPGRIWVPGTNLANISGTTFSKQAMYFALNDASATLTVDPADATNPRIDVVYVAFRDSLYSGTVDDVYMDVLTGTPAVTPTVPTAPANSMVLAQVAVAANATSITTGNITNKLGTALSLVMTNRASGIVGLTTDNTLNTGFTTTEQFLTQIASVPFFAGRRYQIAMLLAVQVPSAANNAIGVNFKTAPVGTTGLTSSTTVRGSTIWSAPTAGLFSDQTIVYMYTPATDGPLRVLASVRNVAGGATFNTQFMQLSVTDLGKQV